MATEIDPALIVNGKCLVRLKHSLNEVVGKFWNVKDLELEEKLRSLLGSQITFADYCFDLGAPSIGALVE